MPTLPLEKTIGEVILDLIKRDSKSISGITRELKGSGINAHKLVITGYLKALRDLGYVRERDMPPLKIYSSSVPHKKGIYEFIGEKISDLELNKQEQIQVAVYVLNKLYHRPIFRHELFNCGFTGDIDVPAVDEARSNETRKVLRKSGIKIQKNELAYEPNAQFEPEFQQIILEILIEQFGLKKLILEGTQIKLETE